MEKALFSDRVLAISLVFTALRLACAALLDLGNDEAYYFTYAVQPDWSHFDHPPMVGLFIRLFTLNLTFVNDVTVRLAAIVFAVANTFLIAKCAMLAGNKAAGYWAALLFNASIYTSIISGLFILPDSGQLFFWLGALLTMLKLTQTPVSSERDELTLWLGVWIGFAVLCKIHGVFLWAGYLGFVLFNDRSLLRRPQFYLSMLITLLLASPIFYWNYQHDFITWRFHSARVFPGVSGLDLLSFLRAFIGQVVYANPFLVVVFAVAVRYFVGVCAGQTMKVLFWTGLPIIFCTTLVSLFRPILPHWSGPGFISLIVLSALYLSESSSRVSFWRSWARVGTGFAFIVILAGIFLIRFYPGTLGSRESQNLGIGDFTLDVSGWDQLATSFAEVRSKDLETDSMSKSSPLIIHKWFPGGHLFYYVGYPLQIPVLGLGKLDDLHKFCWLNKNQPYLIQGQNAYFITSSNDFTDPRPLYGRLFQSVECTNKLQQKRGGVTVRYWYVYRLRNFLGASGNGCEMRQGS